MAFLFCDKIDAKVYLPRASLLFSLTFFFFKEVSSYTIDWLSLSWDISEMIDSKSNSKYYTLKIFTGGETKFLKDILLIYFLNFRLLVDLFISSH